MSFDYAAMEREFLANLEQGSGRSLDAWMEAIKSQNLPHRNDIIDWLRLQGFMFSKASWLERIHHNGGKPLYGGSVTPVSGAGEALEPSKPEEPLAPPIQASAPVSAPPSAAGPTTLRQQPVQRVECPSSALADSIETVLAKAKAYRPLAQFLLREVARVCPGASFTASSSQISIWSANSEFGLLAVTAKDLRLGLALGTGPVTVPFQKARFPAPQFRSPAHITQMIVLTDARQIDAHLLGIVARAASGSGG